MHCDMHCNIHAKWHSMILKSWQCVLSVGLNSGSIDHWFEPWAERTLKLETLEPGALLFLWSESSSYLCLVGNGMIDDDCKELLWVIPPMFPIPYKAPESLWMFQFLSSCTVCLVMNDCEELFAVLNRKCDPFDACIHCCISADGKARDQDASGILGQHCCDPCRYIHNYTHITYSMYILYITRL